ncbi:major facilitator superfamily transporter [Tritrichomonas foetus]|uniref:Major facilitator superfamily transporter n=1 Tax=Tritrichomonas foetus TaxID=1144522 RepID=A0A1J4KR92_9EUKA|nr:major facilitator superfamily transporter [Tritrichomonas foetus]|eukprot:OHT13448.1 major facilitator superfamily transporter [Tritrichomonas foetus]
MTRSFTEITNEFPGYDDLSTEKRWIPLHLREKLSIFRIISICSSMFAFQVAYSVGNSLCTPIMTRLGANSALISVIWMSGPISGFFVQPILGVFSDKCRLKMGRRRPFMIIGLFGILIGFSLLYCIDLLSNNNTIKIIIFALVMLETYISINILQGSSRSLVGDLIPLHQQILATTISSTLISLASVITNLIGGLNISTRISLKLSSTLNSDDNNNTVSSITKFFIGISEEQFIFLVGLILIIITVTITLISATEERIYRQAEKRDNPIKEIFLVVKAMPKPIFRISIVYFFSWMAYYPFLIGVTDFFGKDIYHADPNSGEYMEGVSFGMLVLAVSSGLALLYSPFQNLTIKTFGLKLTFAFSQILVTVCLFLIIILLKTLKNSGVDDDIKWILMGVLSPTGIAFTIFNSIPFAIVKLSIPTNPPLFNDGNENGNDKTGVYMGVLNCFAVVGQQLSNFLLNSGFGLLFNDKAPVLSIGGVFSFIAAIMCVFIILPDRKRSSKLIDPLEPLAPKTNPDF